MSIRRAFVPFDVKFAGDDAPAGTFEGYGAVFNNLDAYRDVIVKGAFKDTLRDWKTRKRMPEMLVQHGGWMVTETDGLPIGKWEAMSEDDHGLAVKGRLINLDTERGKTIYGAMKEGVLDGLSIGYVAVKSEPGTKPEDPRRKLTKIDLHEVSVVTFPANGSARVAQVKAGPDMTLREFEEFLRDAGGFSHAAAKAIATRGYKAADPRDEDEAGIAALIRRNTATLTRKG